MNHSILTSFLSSILFKLKVRRERKRERKREGEGEGEGERERDRGKEGERERECVFSPSLLVYTCSFYIQCSTLSTTLMTMCLLVPPLGVERPFVPSSPSSGCFQLHLTHAASLSLPSQPLLNRYIHSTCTCIPTFKVLNIPYSGKLWRALNLANKSSECIGEF